MSILTIGDPHFKASTARDVEEFISKVLITVEKTKPDAVVVLGDILHDHERLHVSPWNNAVRFLQELSSLVETFLLIGNHDMVNNSSYLTTQHPFNCMKDHPNLTVVDTVIHRKISGVDCIFTPYVPPGRFIEAMETCDVDYKTVDVIFAHQEFKGCVLKDIKSESGDEWPEEYPLVISGHIHGRQQPQQNIIYPGTVMQHTFGEPDDKGLSLFTFVPEFTEKRIELDLPKRLVIHYDVSDPLPEINPRDYTKLVITGSYEKFKVFQQSDSYGQLIKQGVKIAFKHKKETLGQKKSEKVKYHDVLKEVLAGKEDPYISRMYNRIFGSSLIIFVD